MLKIWERAIRLALALGLSLTFALAAGAVETLKWEDLAPAWDKSENPLTELSQGQKDDVFTIIYGPNFGNRSGEKNADEQEAYDRLKASGVNPAAVLATIKKLRQEADVRDRTLVAELDGRDIKLPGYVLPLDFDGSLVKSFLLVPYVGACIHVPPPPPNQIVYVKLNQGFESPELYAPVWVTGRIETGMSKTSLSLVDGSSFVDFGYSLQATKVEPYEE
jgi:hypothetical protein